MITLKLKLVFLFVSKDDDGLVSWTIFLVVFSSCSFYLC